MFIYIWLSIKKSKYTNCIAWKHWKITFDEEEVPELLIAAKHTGTIQAGTEQRHRLLGVHVQAVGVVRRGVRHQSEDVWAWG